MATSLFANGFGFIVPYVAVYLAGRAIDASPASVLAVFLTLHAVNLVLLWRWAWPRRRAADLRMVGFWAVLGLLFLLPGAYLEYPSDPWEHVRRIYAWGTAGRLSDHDTVDRFAYFWAWTWVGRIPVEWRPAGLALYSAWWQLLLAMAFYRLARVLGFTRAWSAVQVVGTVAFFGTNVFSFYRYYALSSTPLAFIAYLFGAGQWLRPDRPRAPALLASTAIAALVAWVNHRQEVLFLIMVVVALGLFEWISRSMLVRRRWTVVAAAAVGLGSLAMGIWLRARRPEVYLGRDTWISWLGGYRLWDPRSAFVETLGLHGSLGILAGCLIAFVKPRLALLTLLPVAALSCPPIVLLVARAVPDDYLPYRILYAFPASMALVAVVASLKGRPAARGALALGLAGLALIPWWPVRGRLPFQLHVPPAPNRLVHLYPVAGTLARHATFRNECLIAGDRITSFFFTTHFGLRHRFSRFGMDDLLVAWEGSPSLDVLIVPGQWDVRVPVCAAALFRPEDIPRSPGSWVARESRHWSERHSNHRAYIRPGYPDLRRRMEDARWWRIDSTTSINPRAITAGRAARPLAAEP